jgi:hypothetical protein
MVLGYVFLSSLAAFGGGCWALAAGHSFGGVALAFYGAGLGSFAMLVALNLLRATLPKPASAPAGMNGCTLKQARMEPAHS